METALYRTLPRTLPEAVRMGHSNLPPATLAAIGSTIERQLVELSVTEQYKRGDIYLSDAAEALGFYPDIARTMAWLQARGVNIGPTPEQYEQSRQALNDLVERRRASLAAHHN